MGTIGENIKVEIENERVAVQQRIDTAIEAICKLAEMNNASASKGRTARGDGLCVLPLRYIYFNLEKGVKMEFLSKGFFKISMEVGKISFQPVTDLMMLSKKDFLSFIKKLEEQDLEAYWINEGDSKSSETPAHYRLSIGKKGIIMIPKCLKELTYDTLKNDNFNLEKVNTEE